MILIWNISGTPCSLRASSGGVLEMEQGAAPAHRFRTPGPGRPSDPTWAPTYERPARSWLTSGRDQKWSDEKRGPRTEIAAVERREARRSWTGDLRPNGDRPDREAGHEVRRIPHQRRLGAPPPSPLEGGSTANLGRRCVARTMAAV